MKLKSLLITAAIAICAIVAPPVMAAPTGDWIDTSLMTPVYESESVTTTNYGAVLAEDCAGDCIIDFSVEMTGRYQIHANYNSPYFNGVLIQTDWGTKNATTGLSSQDNGKHIQYHYYNTSTSKTANGWLTGADTTYPKYSEGAKIAFRVQVKNGVVSTWAADLDDEEGNAIATPVYSYLGSYKYPAGQYSTAPGVARLYTTVAQTLTDIKVYSLKGEMKTDTPILAKKDSSFDVEFTLEPERELMAEDFVLTDSEGNEVSGAVSSVSGSGCNYTITLGQWLEFGEEYTLSLIDGISTIQGFDIQSTILTTEEKPRYKLEITDIAVSSDTVTVSVTRNVNETVSGVAVVGVYNVTDGVEECINIKAQDITDETRENFDLTFTQLQEGSVLRAYILTDLETMKSMAMPQEN